MRLLLRDLIDHLGLDLRVARAFDDLLYLLKLRLLGAILLLQDVANQLLTNLFVSRLAEEKVEQDFFVFRKSAGRRQGVVSEYGG